jgi:hypothetical protein
MRLRRKIQDVRKEISRWPSFFVKAGRMELSREVQGHRERQTSGLSSARAYVRRKRENLGRYENCVRRRKQFEDRKTDDKDTEVLVRILTLDPQLDPAATQALA